MRIKVYHTPTDLRFDSTEADEAPAYVVHGPCDVVRGNSGKLFAHFLHAKIGAAELVDWAQRKIHGCFLEETTKLAGAVTLYAGEVYFDQKLVGHNFSFSANDLPPSSHNKYVIRSASVPWRVIVPEGSCLLHDDKGTRLVRDQTGSAEYEAREVALFALANVSGFEAIDRL